MPSCPIWARCNYQKILFAQYQIVAKVCNVLGNFHGCEISKILILVELKCKIHKNFICEIIGHKLHKNALCVYIICYIDHHLLHRQYRLYPPPTLYHCQKLRIVHQRYIRDVIYGHKLPFDT